MNELTAKQKAFVEQLPLNQWNGTKAAIAAGYSPKSAGVMAHRLLKNPVIAKELDKRTAEIAQKTDVEIGEVIAELRKYAFDREYKATNSERLKALEMLGKYKVMFTDRQIVEDERKSSLVAIIMGDKDSAPPGACDSPPSAQIQNKDAND